MTIRTMEVARQAFLDNLSKQYLWHRWEKYEGVHDVFDEQLFHDMSQFIEQERVNYFRANYYVQQKRPDVVEWAMSLGKELSFYALRVIIDKIHIDLPLAQYIVEHMNDAVTLGVYTNPDMSADAATYLYEHGIVGFHPRVWPLIRAEHLTASVISNWYTHDGSITNDDLEIISQMHRMHKLPRAHIRVTSTTTLETMNAYIHCVGWIMSNDIFIRGLTCEEMRRHSVHAVECSVFAMADDTLDNIIAASNWHTRIMENPCVDKEEFLRRLTEAQFHQISDFFGYPFTTYVSADIKAAIDRMFPDHNHAAFQDIANRAREKSPRDYAKEYQRHLHVPAVFALIIFQCDGLLMLNDH